MGACNAPIASVAQYQLKPQGSRVGVLEIKMGAGGSYKKQPDCYITVKIPSTGTGAQVKAVMRRLDPDHLYVAYVEIDNPGQSFGFTDTVYVNFTGGNGGGAVATVDTSGGGGVGTYADIALPIPNLDYSFTRKTMWATRVRRYHDQATVELMPYQAIATYEFTFHFERWTVPMINALEQTIDQTKGAAYPMWVTAPDDGQIYNVRFKEDASHEVVNAIVRSGDLNIVTIGDIDNSVDNSDAYPPAPGRTYAPAVRRRF
jgi:hypothetical protein